MKTAKEKSLKEIIKEKELLYLSEKEVDNLEYMNIDIVLAIEDYYKERQLSGSQILAIIQPIAKDNMEVNSHYIYCNFIASAILKAQKEKLSK